jgi:hypothetical protein
MRNVIWLVIGYLLYFPLIWWAGNRLCRLVFTLATVEVSTKGPTQEEHALKAGRYIGLFERLLVSLGVIVHHWEIIVAVIALKTVARYRELDNQITAEYFLVGSLVSLLWAVLVTVALLIFDRDVGVGFFQSLPGGIANP